MDTERKGKLYRGSSREFRTGVWQLTWRRPLPALLVRAYVISTLLLYCGGFKRRWSVISTGLVDPGLFLSPRRFALISPPLTLTSDWCGKEMSCLACPASAEQKAMTLSVLSIRIFDRMWSSTALMYTVTVFRCWAMTEKVVSFCPLINKIFPYHHIPEYHLAVVVSCRKGLV